MGIAGDIALILIVALILALIAQRLGFPLLLGYICAGVILSPVTPGPSVGEVHEIELLADIGIALLLFTVGLEFPMEKLKVVRNVALLGAPIQMAVVGLFGFVIGQIMGWELQQSVWFGALISLSSTMVVLKILMSRGLMETLSAKVMLGILVVQDLAVIPLMILLPALGDLEGGLATLGLSLLRATIFVALMGAVGRRFLPWMLGKVAHVESRELFIIVVLGLGLGIGYGTYLVGLSFAFGAFLAGLVLSRSDYSHDALADMIPLREVFSLIFFASVGLMLSPKFMYEHFIEVLVLVVVILVGKGLLMAGITRLFGYTRIIPLAVALSMSQVGEFAFVLARLGRTSGGLDDEVYYITVSVAVISMALTPFSARPAYNLYQWWRRRLPLDEPDLTEAFPSAEGRIVVMGYGGAGEFICQLLREVGHPPLVIGEDRVRVQLAKDAGFDAVLTEEATPEALKPFDLPRARLVLVTHRNRLTVRVIIEALKILGDIPTIALAAAHDHLDELSSLGVSNVVLAPQESGLEMVHQTLLMLEYDHLHAHNLINDIRINHYRSVPSKDGTDSDLRSRLAEPQES